MTEPHISDAIRAEDSSESERKIRVLSVWTSVRHASPEGSTERSEEIDCVATIGMQRHCRVSANAFSSPAGSSWPTVANAWYSSQMNTAGRRSRPGRRAASTGRRSSACIHAFLSSTPMARARAGFAPAGMLSARILPWSISCASGGSRRRSPGMGRTSGILPGRSGVRRGISSGGGGQNTPATSGWSKSERKTLMPSTIEVRSLASSTDQSWTYHRSMASTCSASSLPAPLRGRLHLVRDAEFFELRPKLASRAAMRTLAVPGTGSQSQLLEGLGMERSWRRRG